MTNLVHRRLLTSVAALRYWQRAAEEAHASPEYAIATEGGTVRPLAWREIDALCDLLNRAEPLKVEVSAWRFDDDARSTITLCNDDVENANGFGVYVRNPIAMHVRDFDLDGSEDVHAQREAAFAFADALAHHLACEVVSDLARPRTYAIEPQRDEFAGRSNAPDAETCFECCEEHEATQWAVFDTSHDLPGPDLVEDYPSREQAESAVAALRAGMEAPKPHWARLMPASAHREMVASDIMPAAPPLKRDPLADLHPYIQETLVDGLGFKPEHQGGGTHYLVLEPAPGYRVVVSHDDGADLPDPSYWMVTVNGPESELDGPYATFVYGDDTPTHLTLEQAAAACIAIAMASPGGAA